MIYDIRKEMKFGLRSSKFLILVVGFLFFALLTPVMAKVVLPEILKSQFPGMTEEGLRSMLNLTQLGTIRSYMGDVVEIGSIIVAFTLCGLMAQEISENTIVLPLCSGNRFGSLVTAKMLVFGTMLTLSTTFSLLIDYAYSGLLFSFEIGIMPIIRGGLLQGFYMVFLLANVIMWGTILKKPITTGFVTLAIAFGQQFLAGIFDIQTYLPAGLLAEAQQLTVTPANTLYQTLLITSGIILVLMMITLMRLKRMEFNERA